MAGRKRLRRTIAVLLLAAHLQLLLAADWAQAQAPKCDYNRASPSLDSARSSFQVFSFRCAELELQDLLKSKSLTAETRAGAYELLAAVYFETVRNPADKQAKVLEQFRAVFRAHRNWQGPLDVQAREFHDLMDQAKREVESETVAKPPKESKPPAKDSLVIARRPEAGTTSSKKAWYQNWWVIALGAGAVGAVVLVATSSKGKTDNTLPAFPPPPGGKGR
ncbi:MAG: hypothetical protein HZB43_01470 [candidate division Zixibacteria bacterium]|nr:hypothetical protein [candidate division Zixibacteria bacterium]